LEGKTQGGWGGSMVKGKERAVLGFTLNKHVRERLDQWSSVIDEAM
jgi:hypothetical protein